MADWFRDTFSHSGKATLEFESPRGSVSGVGTVEVDERGSLTVGFRAEHFEYPEEHEAREGYELLDLLTGNIAARGEEGASAPISLARRNLPTSFRLETQEGVVHSTGSMTYWFAPDDEGGWSVSVYPFRLQYDAADGEDAAYWALPLSNFVDGFVQDPSPGVQANPLLRSKRPFNLIEFDFGVGRAFIERVPEYGTRVKELKEGRATNRVTSVMVGEVGDGAHGNLEALEEWLPLHLLGVLGLATGSEVGSPWIELRDDEGGLVRRFYVKPTPPVYIAGHRAVLEAAGAEKLDRLLSAAARSEAADKLNESYLRVIVKLMIRAKLKSATVEDGLAYVTRAVDALCEEYKLKKRQSVQKVLSKAEVKELEGFLAEAADRIHNMAESSATAGDKYQAETLEEIARKTPHVVQLTVGLNRAVVPLLEKFDLPDERIVSPFINEHKRFKEKDFGQAVAAYRGRALHVNYLGITKGDLTKAYNAIILTDHLHDILLRIVFKTIGYSGTYSPTVLSPPDDRPIDWVNEETTPGELGYERFG